MTTKFDPMIFEWRDKETDAVGWVVFDRVINGVTGGGIFMHINCFVDEVAAIAKNMSRKFTVCSPQIGGAKAGIKFDHRDPRAKEVLRRFILANGMLLRNYWVTAGDLNTDDTFIEKVITEELQLSCCQAQLGKVVSQRTGQPDLSPNLAKIIGTPACEFFPLIEGTVGYGLAAAIEEGLKLIDPWKDNLPRVVIQGFGAVGSSLAYYLETKKIARVVAIADKDGILFDGRGLPIVKILQMRKERIELARKEGVDTSILADLSKNCVNSIDPTVPIKEGWGQIIKASDFKTLEDFAVHLASIETDVFCPAAIRYTITPRVVDAMRARLLVSGANNPYGLMKDGKLVEDVDGQVVQLLEQKKVVIVPDWVSNSGTAQLFHRSLSVPFDLGKANIAAEILEACAIPIRLFIHQSLGLVNGDSFRLHRGAERLSAQRLNFPVPIGDPITNKSGHRSRYALPPISTSLTSGQKTQLCLSLAAECIEPKELEALFEKCKNPVAYDGFEPSGRMHIAQGLFKARLVNNLTKAGFTYIFWVADWFAFLNHKMGGNLEAIQTLGKYFIEIWRASGMDMSRVRFLWASEEFSKHGDEYWARVLDISTKNTLTRVKRCCTIMGRKEADELSASQIFYPCMQCADIFFLGVDVCQLGGDQRKVNVLAREYASATKQTPPVILSHPMLPGLKKNQEKMSKSDPSSALFMEDSAEDICEKIKSAFCPPYGEKETVKDSTGKSVERLVVNPCLEYFKWIVFSEGVTVVVKHEGLRKGDSVTYPSFSDFEQAYQQGLISPQVLKATLSDCINTLLQPVRDHFEKDPVASRLLREVKELQARYQK